MNHIPTTIRGRARRAMWRGTISPIALALMLGAAGPALAQAENTSGEAEDAESDDDEDSGAIEDVVVVRATGTNISGVAPVGSEVLTLSEEDIKATGVGNVADAIRTLPQIQRGGSNVDGFESTPTGGGGGPNATRGDALNLRGLGQDATLLLINGRRVAPAGTSQTFTEAVQVPLSALESIEVIADGASAIYGSDAIAGVVNYVLKDDYQGVEVTGAYEFHDYGDEWQAGATGGTSWDSVGQMGRGNILFSYEHTRVNPITRSEVPRYRADQRPYGGNNNIINGNNATPGAAGNIVIARPDPDGPFLPGTATPNPVIPEANTYDYYGLPTGSNENLTFADIAPRYQDPNVVDRSTLEDFRGLSESDLLAVSLNQDLTPDIRFFADARYNWRQTYTRVYFAGGGQGFPATLDLPSSSPYWFQHPDLAPGAALPVQYNLQAHLPDGAEFANKTYNESLSATGGLDFKLFADWNGEAAYTYSQNRSCGVCYFGSYVNLDTSTIEGLPALSHFRQALADGTINPLSSEKLTQDQWDYIRGDNTQYAQSYNHIATAKFDGPLFDLPGGEVRAAIGGEFNTLAHQLQNAASRPPDNIYTPDADSDYDRDVYSVFSELYVPLVNDDMNVPLMQSLSLNGALRYDDYSDFGSTTNPRVGATWTVNDSLDLRGSWGTSYRAPDVSRLQAGVFSVALVGIPFADNSGLGLAPSPIPGNTSALLVIGGNEDLQPEEGENYSLGFDFEPEFLEGLRVSGTWYRTVYDSRLATLPTNAFLSSPENAEIYKDFFEALPQNPGCVESDPSTYPDRVRELIDESLYKAYIFGACGLGVYIDGREQNTVASVQEGYDIQVDYRFTTGMGLFNVGGNFTKILESSYKPNVTTPATSDLDTLFGPISARARGYVSWYEGPWAVSVFANYTGSFTNNLPITPTGASQPLPVEEVDSWLTGDLNVTYTFDEGRFSDSALQGTRLSVNINNFTDEEAPIVLTGTGSVNGNHDPFGRTYRFSVTKAF